MEKYGRSLHAQISLGTTSDDRFMPNGYVTEFSKMDNLVITEKLDGQNNCFKKSGLYARTHVSPSNLPWDKPLIEKWNLIKNDLGSLEIFGEGMYGIHSIEYSKLESYFYVFGVRDKGIWLSWEEVEFYASLFDFPTVPVIEFKNPLKDFLHVSKDENEVLREWLISNLGMSWEDYTNTDGKLGGFDPLSGEKCSEGFVIRNANSYEINSGNIEVSHNEFNNLFKLVRESHVKTDTHWTKTWRKAKLINYSKYNWDSYQYLNI